MRSISAGISGDLGQIEVKVCYTHHYAGKINMLVTQLEKRREQDRLTKAPTWSSQHYHGVIWLFQHGWVEHLAPMATELTSEATRLGLIKRQSFRTQEAADPLGRLWPSLNGQNYSCGLSLAFFELVETS